MGALKDLANKLKSQAPKQEAEILKIVEENENLIIDLNTGQLMEGIDSQEIDLRDYASEQYSLFKLRFNPKGVTDLNLTGAFHRSFVLVADRWPVIFSASDHKTEDLTEKYGENIFGLTEKNKTIVAHDYLKVSIQEYYRRLLQL